jgi:DNA polymerase V
VENSAATFYIRVTGNSMTDEGIDDGDLLIVDRSKTAKNDDIVIGVLNGEFTVKKIQKTKTKLFLVAANKDYKKIEISEEMDFSVWGVVTYVVHKTR